MVKPCHPRANPSIHEAAILHLRGFFHHSCSTYFNQAAIFSFLPLTVAHPHFKLLQSVIKKPRVTYLLPNNVEIQTKLYCIIGEMSDVQSPAAVTTETAISLQQ